MRPIIADLMNPAKYLHVMLDLETTATNSSAGVWQYGLATSIGDLWEGTCDPITVLGSSDEETIAWQGDNNGVNWNAARCSTNNEHYLAMDLLDIFIAINQHAKERGVKLCWWAKSKDFDFPIVENLMRRHGKLQEYKQACKFWERHEYRTIQLLTDVYAKPPKGQAHNAAVDARFQMDSLFNMLAQLA